MYENVCVHILGAHVCVRVWVYMCEHTECVGVSMWACASVGLHNCAFEWKCGYVSVCVCLCEAVCAPV